MNIEPLELIGILGGWSIIITGIIYFVSQKLSDRLNIKWQETSQKRIEKNKNELSQKNELISNLLNFQNTNFNISQEKRLLAIEKIWENINHFKNKTPSSLVFIFNILEENEIEEFLTSKPKNKEVEFMISEMKAFDKYNFFNDSIYNSQEIINLRPYLGEDLWFSYETYNAFLGRFAYKIHEDVRVHKKLRHWHHDSSIMAILKNYLSENEMYYLEENKMNSFKIALNLLDSKMLYQMNHIISGKLASENALDRAIKLVKLE